MSFDLCDLMRRDHDDLDRALAPMVDPRTPTRDLANLQDVLRLALAVHAAAGARVLDLVIERLPAGRALRELVAQLRREHAAQLRAAETLTHLVPATAAWYERVLELRVHVLDHDGRGEQLRWRLQDHAPFELQRTLAAEYATERMRVLTTTSPYLVAQRRESAALLG